MVQVDDEQLPETWLQYRILSGAMKIGDENSNSETTPNTRVQAASFSSLSVASRPTCITIFECRLSLTCGKLIDVSSTISTTCGRGRLGH